ncbi:unnamed protein product [marine sediment metagenome]|uniref:L-2-amino-thiazoline-4-carboxylic acid hydrolase n=1 Tax=marine sediment metagenome TaxID=412755 RepID=X0ZL09_9ZZZZ
MKDVSIEDKLFYFERNFFTLDGLFVVEIENQTDFETALKIDLMVWQKFLNIILGRIKRYLSIKSDSIKDLVEILSFRWSCEGWEYEIVKNEEKEADIEIKKCPYKAMMDRNEERHHLISQICKKICIPLYKSAIESFNPKIQLKRDKFMGLGDNICQFHFKLI